MTTPRDARLAYALLKIRMSQINKALKTVQPYIDQEPGDKNTAKLGAAKLGRVQVTDPEVKATVTDPALFTKWVQENRPDEVEQVPTVGATFRKALLEEMDRKGALVNWDGLEVPGVEFTTGSTPQQRFYPEDDADELLAVVAPEDLPQIEGVDLAGLLGVRGDVGDDPSGAV